MVNSSNLQYYLNRQQAAILCMLFALLIVLGQGIVVVAQTSEEKSPVIKSAGYVVKVTANTTVETGLSVPLKATIEPAGPRSEKAKAIARAIERLKVTWKFTPPPGSRSVISQENTLDPKFIADVPGDYNLLLEVTDGEQTYTDEIKITAAAPTTQVKAEPDAADVDSAATADDTRHAEEILAAQSSDEIKAALAPLPRGWVREPSGGITNVPVTATGFEGKVYSFAKGIEGRIWLQVYDYVNNTWLPYWTEVPGGGLINGGMAATSTSSTLYLFVKGLDNQVWLNKKSLTGSPTTGWTGWGREVPAGPVGGGIAAIATNDGTVYIFRSDPSGPVYYSRTSSGGWQAWASVPALSTLKAPAAAYDKTKNIIYIFTTTSGWTGGIFMNKFYAGAWRTSACRVPGAGTNYGMAAVAGDGQLYLTHITLAQTIQAQVYGESAYDACGVWSGPADLYGGGATNAAPAAVLVPNVPLRGGQFMVFVKGMDEGIYYHFFGARDIVAEVTTRGQFDVANGTRRDPNTAYNYATAGVIPGMTLGTECPSELAIAVHGWDNGVWGGQDKAQRARLSLEYVGYTGPVIGFSWDSNTKEILGSGFDEGKAIADGNGTKLANFIDDYKYRCRGTRIHLMGHSLGARVVLKSITALANDSFYYWNRVIPGTRIDDVHLLGAAVDNEVPQTNEWAGSSIENEVFWLNNYWSSEDDTLSNYYWGEEADQALGESGIENWSRRPYNYFEVNMLHIIGDDHQGYWGYRYSNGDLRSYGAMYDVRIRFR